MKKPVPKSKRISVLKGVKSKLISVANGYNKSTSECNECGLTHYSDFEEYKLWVAVQSAISKINRVIESEMSDEFYGEDSSEVYNG